MTLQRYSVTDNFESFFRDNGYVILNDVFTPQEIEQTRHAIIDLFENRFAHEDPDAPVGEELITTYYESEKTKWRQCASQMWNLIPVKRMGCEQDVVDAIRKTGLHQPIFTSPPEVRIDMPEDDQYRQPWHQDWRYGQGSWNSVTIWIPLHDVGTEEGTIDIKPATHLLGYLETQELSNPRRFEIVDSRIDDYDTYPVELKMGEVVIFSQMLAHRSGHNVSGAPRFSVQLRYSDYAESAFVRHGYPRPNGSEMIWKDIPGEEALRKIYQS